MTEIAGIIPARLSSTRLERKMLLDLGGKPLIVRTVEAVRKSKLIGKILVATDSAEIETALRPTGIDVVMTDSDLASGSDRIHEAAKGYDFDIIVNVQGDEPLIPPEVIDSTISLLINNDSFDVTTASTPINIKEARDPNIVKVIFNQNGEANYFSRSQIPYPRVQPNSDKPFHRHIGIYCYRKDALEDFCRSRQSDTEVMESLEQLRLLHMGRRIGVVSVDSFPGGVDTAEDLERVRRLINSDNSEIK